MKRSLLVLSVVGLALVACAQSAPVPATPAGGGNVPTATRPAGAGGTQSSGGGSTVSADRGKQLVTEKGCIACHVIKSVPGAVGTIGPALDGVGDPAARPKIAGGLLDNTPDNLKKWLANPPAIKPGTLMPNLSLSANEMDNLIAFLETLK